MGLGWLKIFLFLFYLSCALDEGASLKNFPYASRRERSPRAFGVGFWLAFWWVLFEGDFGGMDEVEPFRGGLGGPRLAEGYSSGIPGETR